MPLICDLCKQPSTSLRRIAMDNGYDRLTVKHQEMYACYQCSTQKEEERIYGDLRSTEPRNRGTS